MNILQKLIKSKLFGSCFFILVVVISSFFIDFKRMFIFDLKGIFVFLEVLTNSIIIILVIIRSSAKLVDTSLTSIVASIIGGGGVIFLNFFNFIFYDKLITLSIAPFFIRYSLNEYFSLFYFDMSLLFIITLIKAFIVFSYISLGRSFSVFPAARKLKTKGFYKYFRHPLYTFFMMNMFIYITFITFSFFNLIVLIVIITMIFYRIILEEKILMTTFGEEYYQYKQNVKRFWII